MATTREMADAVMAHAKENYDAGDGWDYVVECFTIEDIEAVLVKENIRFMTEKAIEHFAWLCGLWNERRKDIEEEAF